MTTVKGLAFFDLDGTLLDGNSQITAEISTAMKALQDNQIIPVIATGRTNLEITGFAEQTGINSFITMNGQHVLFEGDTVYSQSIPKEVCQRLYHKTQELNHEIGYYTPTSICVSAHTPMVKKAYDFINSPLPRLDATFYEENNVNMFLAFCEENDDLYHEAFPELTFFRNGPHAIDIISKGGSKGSGVRELVKALHLEGVPTYGFGDGTNDIDLLKACDNRIAMGNAIPALKELATYVTAKNTEGGIIQALRHFNLID